MMLPKVLIVEDDETIREIYALKLEMEGYPTATAQNGAIALEVAKEFEPDIILLDMMMPVMGGLEFMKHYGASKKRAPHIIVFSNISAPTHMTEMMELGAAAYWIKSDYTPDRVVLELRERWQDPAAARV